MKIHLISVGTKMPDWVDAGVAEYRKRLPRDFELLITEIPLAPRGKGADISKAKVKEGEACLRAVGKGDTAPLVPNTSTTERAKNRRIEIAIIPTDG